jgi:hypothetical protein
MNYSERMKPGFKYLVQHLRAGIILSEELTDNLVPLEGENYILNASFRGAAQSSTWYIGLYSGDYTPTQSITAATLNAVATELIYYDAATRVAFSNTAATTGTLSNVATPAEFVSTIDSIVYGGFISSSAAKGSGSGLLGSVVRFASPKPFHIGDVLRVLAGVSLASA